MWIPPLPAGEGRASPERSRRTSEGEGLPDAAVLLSLGAPSYSPHTAAHSILRQVPADVIQYGRGDSHYEHGAQERDRKRDAFLQEKGFTVLRLSNRRVLEDTDAIVAHIVECLEEYGSPSP